MGGGGSGDDDYDNDDDYNEYHIVIDLKCYLKDNSR
mgnify:CR=1 FL=1